MKPGRKPRGATVAQSITLKLHAGEIAKIDESRGDCPRSTFARERMLDGIDAWNAAATSDPPEPQPAPSLPPPPPGPQP